MASAEESCSKGIKTVLANTVRGVALAVWGTQPRDSMLIAEMSLTGTSPGYSDPHGQTVACVRQLALLESRSLWFTCCRLLF
jgi:hypothetical protein